MTADPTSSPRRSGGRRSAGRAPRRAPAGTTAPTTESSPDSARATKLRVEGKELLIVSVPALDARLPSRLTAAESEVMRLMLQGKTNGDIAKQRQTSVRTVANQAASIYRKLGVHGRAELGRRLLPD